VGSARYRPESGPPVEIEVTIAGVGARGDGIAGPDGEGVAAERVFVPLTVPGDRVRVRLGPAQAEGRRGQVVAWLARGPDAVAPACRHFGRCGGCTLQHLGDPAYDAWKREQVTVALTRAGFGLDRPVPLVRTPPGGRRRATFSVRRRGGAVLVGFNERLSHRLVDLEECPVLAPELVALVPALRRGLAPVLPEDGGAEVAATRLEGGLDVVLVGPVRLDLTARQALADLAEAADIGRLSWQPDPRQPPEPVAARRPVLARFGGRPVPVPPGAFLQASAEGEAALVAAVLEGVGGTGARASAGAVADLFAGCGTFSLALVAAAVAGRRVHGVDGNGAALAALAEGGRGLPGLTTERRDLGRAPLSSQELAGYRVVVFDPPRAGAAAQAAALAASNVPVVVAVSCNPATFARDARRLGEGGYRLVSALAVDQFLWSAHIELVAVFHR
jgi:23S rRNA (uracil1939-C5)-methyltransferase